MNNLCDFANFGELQFLVGQGRGSARGGGGGGANESLRPGRQRPSLRLCDLHRFPRASSAAAPGSQKKIRPDPNNLRYKPN